MIQFYDITEDDLRRKSFEVGCLYYCTDSKKIYLDSEKSQKRIEMSGDMQFSIENVFVKSGDVILDSRITENDEAVFIPDLSCFDLVSDINCTCSNGSVTITMTSNYSIPGKIIVN